MRAVGEILRLAREKKGLTQTETARILRFSEQYLGHMENGQCSVPFDRAKELQKLFKIKTSDLMDAYLTEYEKKVTRVFKSRKKIR